MSANKPIYSIAKELDIDSHRIISACEKLGIAAKAASKRLNKEETSRVKSYFEKGKNVSEEIIDINNNKVKKESKSKNIPSKTKIRYFRCVGCP